jgi:hypothetical protein
MKPRNLIAVTLSAGILAGCAATPEKLVGAWHGEVQFQTGAFAPIKDLEFMYVFNAGGTMTESSNYDSTPPVPPAYGIWRRIGPGQYEAKYMYFSTKPPRFLEDLLKGGGWMPAGQGVLLERITLAPDGNSFTSTIRFDVFDQAGKVLESGTMAKSRSIRVGF